MELRAPDHPLIAHKVTLLRNVGTDSPTFRALTGGLMNLLAYEALNLDGDSYRLRAHHAANDTLRRTTTGTRQPLT